MSLKPRFKRNGYALIAVGIAFFGIAVSGSRNAFYALGVVFLVLGAAAMRNGKDQD